MKKNVVNILQEDEIYRIADRVACLQDEIKARQDELDTLRTRGAEIMQAHQWSHAKCAKFTVYLMDHYAGFNWTKITELYPELSKKCFSHNLKMKIPKITVTRKMK